MGEVTVRPAVAADENELLALDSTGWPPGTGFPSYARKRGGTFFTEKRRPEGVLVAVLDGRVAGYVMVKPKVAVEEAAHVFGLWGLVVSPAVRRRGVASALLAAAEQAAIAQGARKLSLHVLGTNTAAMALYERSGYMVEGRYRDEFLIDGRYVDDVSLGKFLTA
jgi:ribosomal protein S18 acetylase RimI-like enzyme